jgi:hypothetical protein
MPPFNVFRGASVGGSTLQDMQRENGAAERSEAQAAFGPAARAYLQRRVEDLRRDCVYQPGETLDRLAYAGGRIAELEALLILSAPKEPTIR